MTKMFPTFRRMHLLMPLQAQGPTGKWCSWTFGYLHRVVNSTAMVNLDGAHHQQGPWADIHSYNYNNWFILSRTILTVVTASQELYCSTSVQARCMYGWWRGTGPVNIESKQNIASKTTFCVETTTLLQRHNAGVIDKEVIIEGMDWGRKDCLTRPPLATEGPFLCKLVSYFDRCLGVWVTHLLQCMYFDRWWVTALVHRRSVELELAVRIELSIRSHFFTPHLDISSGYFVVSLHFEARWNLFPSDGMEVKLHIRTFATQTVNSEMEIHCSVHFWICCLNAPDLITKRIYLDHDPYYGNITKACKYDIDTTSSS
jgi:hypothetical protein